MLICIFFVCLALLTNRNSVNKHRDLNKKQQVIIGATFTSILLPAALLISYILIKQQWKRRKNEQLLMDDRIEAYSANPLRKDNITFHEDNKKLL